MESFSNKSSKNVNYYNNNTVVQRMCFLIELFNLKAIKTCNSCRRSHILTIRVQDYTKVIERLESSLNFDFNVSLVYRPQKNSLIRIGGMRKGFPYWNGFDIKSFVVHLIQRSWCVD